MLDLNIALLLHSVCCVCLRVNAGNNESLVGDDTPTDGSVNSRHPGPQPMPCPDAGDRLR